MKSNDKQTLRREMLEKRHKLTLETMKSQAEKTAIQLVELVRTHQISTIHSYIPLNKEVDTWPFINKAQQLGCRIAVPKTMKSRKMKHLALLPNAELVAGLFQTVHPKLEQHFAQPFDLVIVPIVAFDRWNNRLGYGGGYYDTFLAKEKRAMKVGLAYPFQQVNKLIVEPHDIPLDLVIY